MMQFWLVFMSSSVLINGDDFFSSYVEITSPPPEEIGALSKCGEDAQKDKFKCVPYYNCDPNTNTIVHYLEVDGSNSTRPRFADPKCGHYLEVCCQVTNTTEHSVKHTPKADPAFDLECGIQSDDSPSPWIVELFKPNKNRGFCVGSLISSVLVLTAAHCVADLKPEQIQIRTGDFADKSLYQKRNVTGIIIHEHYLNKAFYNDIALLILNNSLTKTNNVRTICLLNNNDNLNNCTVIKSSTLRTLQVLPISNKKCQTTLRKKLGDEFLLHQSFMCTDGNKTCTGDGGAPLVCSNSSRYYQVGLVSWGLGCKMENVPDVYTNVLKFKDWIDYKVQELGYNIRSYTPQQN